MKTENDRYVLFCIVLFVFLFLSVTQTLTSGFHFVDDHEIVRIKYDLRESSLSEVTGNWIKEDMNSTARFRPLYFANRVFMTWIFGSDFFFWSLYNGLLWCITMIFFYLGARNLMFNIFESVIFLVISFIGPQSEIWWRLGPQESLGVTFLSIAFFVMSLSIHRKRYQLNNLIFALFLVLASLVKESFILVMPAFIFLKVITEKTIHKGNLKELIFRNTLLLIPLGVGLLELLLIKYRIGTSYSGIAGDPGAVLSNLFNACLDFLQTYLNLIIAGIILLTGGIFMKKRIFWFDPAGFIFFILIFIPNILLYARTGLMERYLLPTSIGLAFFIVSCLKDVADNSLLYRKASYILILFSFLPYIIQVTNDASAFATEGRETDKLLDAIALNHEEGSQVLAVVDPMMSYEKSVSLKTYLFCENGLDLYGYPVMPDSDNVEMQGYLDGWESYFSGQLYENMTSKPGMLIFLDSRLSEKFFQSGPLMINNFEPVESGSYTYSVFKRKSED